MQRGEDRQLSFYLICYLLSSFFFGALMRKAFESLSVKVRSTPTAQPITGSNRFNIKA
jgi:hypothetical protein